ncbi:hypothetical protein ACLSYX_09740 [[Pasteurella] aerogenes]
MLRKILKSFITDRAGRIGIETAKRILGTEPISLQSFVLCTKQDNSDLKAGIATKQAIATVFNKREFMIEINLDYVNAAKWHIDNIYNQIDKIQDTFSIIYLESSDLAFLQDDEVVKSITYLAKTVRKFKMKLILALPISNKEDLMDCPISENATFIKF